MSRCIPPRAVRLVALVALAMVTGSDRLAPQRPAPQPSGRLVRVPDQAPAWAAGNNWYDPQADVAPLAREPLPDEAPAVVVVAACVAGRSRPLLGNGVLIHGTGLRGGNTVLTCAHLVEADGVPADAVRVGLFRDSFRRCLDPLPRYLEVEATVLAIGRDRDLALLEIVVPAVLQRLAVGAWPLETAAVSIVPFGQPTRVPGPPRRIRAGQSGTPAFFRGAVSDLARGNYEFDGEPGCSLSGAWIGSDTLLAFLENAKELGLVREAPSSP